LTDSIRLTIDPPIHMPGSPSVVTIGVFDGVHLGHRALIGQAVERARALGVRSVAITFSPHPREVLARGEPVQYLTDIDERRALIHALGVDVVATLHFNLAVAGLSADAFLAEIEAQLGLVELWVGPDFALGHHRHGTVPVLQEIGRQMGFAVHTVPPVVLDGVVVSSSNIRRMLLEGDVAGAAVFLGRPYTLEGTVEPGARRGRQLGFPTANIPLSATRVVPANGIYVVRALTAQGLLPAVANVGIRPTFGQNEPNLEVHILDFEGDLYGQHLRVAFLRRLRSERRFASIADLQAQIQADVYQARAYFQTAGKPA